MFTTARKGPASRSTSAVWAAMIMAAIFWPPVPAPAESPSSSSCTTFGAVADAELRGLLARDPLPSEPLLHQKVSTPVAAAQTAYDRGISHLAVYEWLRAAQSFQSALRADPGLALAYVGLGKALWELDQGPAVHRCLDAAKAAAAARSLSARERAWILLAWAELDLLESAGDEQAAKRAAYRDEIDRRLPLGSRDAHDHVLAGLAAGPQASLSHFRAALERDPHHVGARHLLVHSLEDLARFEDALPHALRLREEAPSSPHAQHMAGHVLAHLDRWRDALAQFRTADRLHEQDQGRYGLPRHRVWHFRHNLRALALAHWRLGNQPRAERRLRQLFDLPDPSSRSGLSCAPWLEYLLLYGRFREADRGARACSLRPGIVARVVGAGALAESALGLGDEATAERRLADALADLDRFRSESPTGTHHGSDHTRLQSFLRPIRLGFRLRGRSDILIERSVREYAARATAARSFDDWALGLLRIERLERLLENGPRDSSFDRAEGDR